MGNSQWRYDQAVGERIRRRDRRDCQNMKLGAAVRAAVEAMETDPVHGHVRTQSEHGEAIIMLDQLAVLRAIARVLEEEDFDA